MTPPPSSPIEAAHAAEVAALREGCAAVLGLVELVASRNDISLEAKAALTHHWRITLARDALSLTPSAAAEKVRRMERVIEAAHEVSAYHGQPAAAIQKRLDALDAAVAALDQEPGDAT